MFFYLKIIHFHVYYGLSKPQPNYTYSFNSSGIFPVCSQVRTFTQCFLVFLIIMYNHFIQLNQEEVWISEWCLLRIALCSWYFVIYEKNIERIYTINNPKKDVYLYCQVSTTLPFNHNLWKLAQYQS